MEALTPFQRALAKGRDRYNARFRMARHRTRGLDPQGFLVHLRDGVGPVVDAAAAVLPAVRADPVPMTDALVDISLALAEQGRLDTAGTGFRRLLPAVAPFVGTAPRRVPLSVLNALHHLARSPSGDPARWADTVAELAERIEPSDVDMLLAAAAVAAWRHGLAELRDSALAAAATLRPDLVRTALGTRSTVDLAALAADPWADPGRPGGEPALVLVRRVGAFTGFGGVFRRPPTVGVADGRWYAAEGDRVWRVFADRFGIALRRADPPGAAAAEGELRLEQGGRVVDTSGVAAPLVLPELAAATSACAHGRTLAATTGHSHGILFVARVGR